MRGRALFIYCSKLYVVHLKKIKTISCYNWRLLVSLVKIATNILLNNDSEFKVDKV